MSLLELFCAVDDFWHIFAPRWHAAQLPQGAPQRRRAPHLSTSEIMTILIHFHQSHYRNFKRYYQHYVLRHLRAEFPNLVSYNRFVELTPRVLVPLLFYFLTCRGTCTGIAFIDSTVLDVCHPKRIRRHRVFATLAARGKSSMGWFYGFKLHLIVNDQGELLTFLLTPGNVDDRAPVPDMTRDLFGLLVGDKGYISQKLFAELYEQGLKLVTPIRKNMKNRLMHLEEKLLLRKRAIIETVNDQLKNISQIEHTRHRSPTNFLVNLVCGLIAYCHQPKKPAITVPPEDMALLNECHEGAMILV
jgi:transposase